MVKHKLEYSGLLEDIKEFKVEKKHYLEKINQIPNLE